MMLLRQFLKRMFLLPPSEGSGTANMAPLELVVTPDCNLACSYCYFHKHKDELYPASIRSRDTIKDNLRYTLAVLQANNLVTMELRLFSGEIWDGPFGVEILEIILNAGKDKPFTEAVAIPSNCSFVLTNEENIQRLIDAFKEIGVRLHFSGSIDGLHLDNRFRQYKGSGKTHLEEDYDKILSFITKNNFGIHPMVSPDSVEHWIANYDWFMEKFRQYDRSPHMMLLEVRDGNWSDENIRLYMEFITYVFNHKLNCIYKGDFLQFVRDNMRWNRSDADNQLTPYSNLELICRKKISCSIQETVFLRLGDLAFVPCHRLMYEKFIYGRLGKTQDYSISIMDGNTELAVKIWSVNPEYGLYGCENCNYNYFCDGPCLGANYEFCGDPMFVMDKGTCKMQKARIRTLAKLYVENGLLQLIADDCIRSRYREVELEACDRISRIVRGDYDE